MRTLKQENERSVRTTISMPPVLYDFAFTRVREAGFATFSDFVQHLFRVEKEKCEKKN